ncbi:DNA-binding transcriptional regulator LsrR, DeoR family [Pilibacter termitis]|uniref:DNA-binding transcriptional regulator LsrR, DeoR family n=1 Tax=Pilibacter termitis TaxID=263852 RepID=A0A1T4P6G5_9ENTE|nr:sugar-binding transcriptional regulator [Pilibacter termitis]SJZ86518.1 DNA-binding transcriptional regulator LsrR, DeoR family [Pilibacter termitis]
MKEDKRRLLAKIAYLYYVEDKTQAQIAKELDIYRTSISRMLTQAKREGIVKIEIQNTDAELLALENQFKNKYGLKYLEVLPNNPTISTAEQEELFAELAGSFVRKIIKNDQTIGLSWGSTLSRVIHHINKKTAKNLSIVPLAGAPSHTNSRFHVNTLVYELAKKTQGHSVFINTTVIQETPQLANGILSSKYFGEIKNLWEKLDVAIVGIGGHLATTESQWRDLLTLSDNRFLQAKEVVGDCCCRFFDKDGNVAKGELYERTIGITLERLKEVPISVGIAYGEEKAQAILALLKQGALNTLITDQNTLLEMKALWELE